MTKKLPDLTDMREIAIAVQKRIGGIDEIVKWAKSHRSQWYGTVFPKLMSQPAQTNVQVNVVANGEEARRTLEAQFMRVIEAKRASVGDPAVYVDGERVYDGPVIDANVIEHAPQPQTIAGSPSSPARDAAQQSAAPDADGDSFGTVCSSATTAVAAPDRPDKPFHPAARPSHASQAGGPSTTQLYLDWVAHGGGDRFGGT